MMSFYALDKTMKVVIPTAGFGTRMLPLSKAVPKELLPLGKAPVVSYVIEEALLAGATTIVLVNSAGKDAIVNHFDANAALDAHLRKKGKDALADRLLGDVTLISVRQSAPLGLGHAVLQAKPVVGDAPFAVLLPDVVLDPFDARTVGQNLIYMMNRFAQTGRMQVLVDAVAQDDIDKYGIASIVGVKTLNKTDVSTHFEAQGFIEKPNSTDAPSNLAVVGRYVFDAGIFAVLEATRPGAGGEIQLTDAISTLLPKVGCDVVTMVGQSFDTGDMQGYARAFVHFARHQGLLDN